MLKLFSLTRVPGTSRRLHRKFVATTHRQFRYVRICTPIGISQFVRSQSSSTTTPTQSSLNQPPTADDAQAGHGDSDSDSDSDSDDDIKSKSQRDSENTARMQMGTTLEAGMSNVHPDMPPLLKTSRFRHVYELIQQDDRVKLPRGEYQQICNTVGVNQEESDNLLRSLHDCGLVYYIPNSPQTPIVIKPEEISRAFLRVLDINGNFTKDFEEQVTQELDAVTREREPLLEIKTNLDLKAQRYADRCMKTCLVGVTAMSVAIVRLTFWDLSWDIMEPVTYMLNLVTMTAGISYFCLYSDEYTYFSIKDVIARSRRRKYYRKDPNFDEQNFNDLTARMDSLQLQLQQPELSMVRGLQPNSVPGVSGVMGSGEVTAVGDIGKS